MANVLDSGLVASMFEFQLHYNVLSDKYPRGIFEIPCCVLNSISAILQGWLWHKITHEGWYDIKQRNGNQSLVRQGNHWGSNSLLYIHGLLH